MSSDCQNTTECAPQIPQLVTIAQAAPLVGRTPYELIELCRAGRLRTAGKRGRTWLIPLEALMGLQGQASA